jgi:hypothetical protein
MKFVLFLVSLTFLAFTSAKAKADDSGLPNGFQLQCSMSTVVTTQPCQGVNHRYLSLTFAPSQNKYQEERSYGGCYPVSDSPSGKITNIKNIGEELSFDLVPEESNLGTVPARLNLRTWVLDLDTRNVAWFYRYPNTLKCTEPD